MKSLFEQIGGTYTQVVDYLLPDVELPEENGVTASQLSEKSESCVFQSVSHQR